MSTKVNPATSSGRWKPWLEVEEVPASLSILHHWMWKMHNSGFWHKSTSAKALWRNSITSSGAMTASELSILEAEYWRDLNDTLSDPVKNIPPEHYSVRLKELLDSLEPAFVNPLIEKGATAVQIREAAKIEGRRAKRHVLHTATSGDPSDTSSVYLCAFDLSKGYVQSRGLNAHGATGVWHTSVFAFGCEYQFGESINRTDLDSRKYNSVLQLLNERAKVTATWNGEPVSIFKFRRVGTARVDYETLEAYIQKLHEDRFAPGTYDLVTNNCVHFATDLLYFLTRQVPGSVYRDQMKHFAEASNADRGAAIMLDMVKHGFVKTVVGATKHSMSLFGNIVASHASGTRRWLSNTTNLFELLKKFRGTKATEQSSIITPEQIVGYENLMIDPLRDGRSNEEQIAELAEAKRREQAGEAPDPFSIESFRALLERPVSNLLVAPTFEVEDITEQDRAEEAAAAAASSSSAAIGEENTIQWGTLGRPYKQQQPQQQRVSSRAMIEAIVADEKRKEKEAYTNLTLSGAIKSIKV